MIYKHHLFHFVSFGKLKKVIIIIKIKSICIKNCLSLAKSSEFDIDQCIVCQKKIKLSLTSTKNGRKKIIDAAAIQKDELHQRLQNSNIDINFNYTSPIPASKTIGWRRHWNLSL